MSQRKSKPGTEPEYAPGELTLMGHLEELRDRLIKTAIAVFICTIISMVFTKQLLQLLIAPYGERLQILGPTEGIAVYFRVALTSGLIISMPYIIYQVIMFILPGLHPNEKRYVIIGVPSAMFLFLTGVAFAWFIMLPAAIGFLSSFMPEVFSSEWQSKEYIPFVSSLIFWIGVSFEMPLLIYFLAHIGLVTPQFLVKQWRFAVLLVAILAAVITPTVDPFNMALVMGPLIVLYGVSILLAYLA